MKAKTGFVRFLTEFSPSRGYGEYERKEVSTMEALGMADFVVGFGVAFITMLALIGAAAAVVLAGTAEEEKAGHRLLWAEWPMGERVEAAPTEVEILKAA